MSTGDFSLHLHGMITILLEKGTLVPIENKN